jgi:hypothetical protein
MYYLYIEIQIIVTEVFGQFVFPSNKNCTSGNVLKFLEVSG